MQNFIQKIDKYQLKITQKLRGKLVAKVLENLMGYAPNNQQVTYVYCLLWVRTQKAKDCEPNDYLQIPVEYLFSLMTPFSVQEYNKTISEKYMKSVTEKSIKPLGNFITFTNYTKGYCRRFMIQEELMTGIKEELIRMIDGEDDDMHFAKPDLNVGLKPAKWGGKCLDSNKLPEVTRKAEMLNADTKLYIINYTKSSKHKLVNKT